MYINFEKNDTDIIEASLTGEMTIYSAAELKSSLVNNIKDCSGINLDLSAVSKIDTAGYQLLLAARQEAVKKNISLKFMKPSQEVQNIFELYGESC